MKEFQGQLTGEWIMCDVSTIMCSRENERCGYLTNNTGLKKRVAEIHVKYAIYAKLKYAKEYYILRVKGIFLNLWE